MADFLSFLDTVTAWHWWALAAILIGIEIISTTFYLFWPGAAAAIVGVLVFF